MGMRFANRTIIVAGAAQGIGLACVGAFIEEGASVVLADIDEERLADVIEAMPKEFSRRAIPVVCDVGNARQVQALIAHTISHFGSLDSFVMAAAVAGRTPFLEVSENEFDAIVRVNLKGAFLCVQEAAKAMVALRDREKDILGSIVTFTADDAFSAIPNIAPFIAAAGGVERMTRTLARSLAQYGLRINAVATGPVDTKLLRAAVGTGKTALNAALNRIAQARVAEPDEIARMVLFAASAESSAITGQILGTGTD